MTSHDTTPHTVGWAVTTDGPHAEQIIDHDTYVVEVDLNPIAGSLLTDLARALHRIHSTWRLQSLAVLPAGSQDWVRQLHHLTADPGVRNALRVLLTPTLADALGGELLESAEQPPACEYGDCPNYAATAARLCGLHADHLDAVSDRIARGAAS